MEVDTFILFTEKDKNLDITINSLQCHGFTNITLVKGIVRKENKSKIVYQSWKRFLNENKDKFDKDIMLVEDDVIVMVKKDKLQSNIKQDKINSVFYQKLLKNKDEMYQVGSQVIYIPHNKIEVFIDQLNKDTPMHFDRWLGRLDDIHYPCKPKEWGVEIPGSTKLWTDSYSGIRM